MKRATPSTRPPLAAAPSIRVASAADHRLTIVAVSILLFCLMAAMVAHKPVHLDSSDFAAAAKAAADTGRPVYYRGEFMPQHIGLWHPPLYVYLLAGWFAVFGSGPAQGCAFGVLCAILQGLAVIAVIETLWGAAVRARMAPWFWPVFLLNPYTIQTAAILDIDSTIYGPILLLVLLFTLRLSWRDGEWRDDPPAMREFAYLTAALALAFWAKLTTVILVIPFVCLLLARRFGILHAVRITVLCSGAAFALFFVTFFGYGRLVDLEVRPTFDFLLFSFVHRGSSGRGGLAGRLADSWQNVSGMVPFMIRWTGLVPWVLLAAAIGVAGWAAVRSKSKRAEHFFWLMLLAAGTTVYYCLQTTTFGSAPFKYTFVFWGLALAAVALFAAEGPLWQRLAKLPADATPVGRKMTLLLAVVFAAAAWVGRYRVGDRPMLEWRNYWWVVIPPVILLIPTIYAAVRRSAISEGSRAALLAGVCAWAGFEFGVAAYQLQAPYSTTYDYGQAGIEETAGFLRANTSPEEAVGGMKDLAYLLQRRYYDTYGAVWAGPEATRKFIDEVAAGHMKFIVFTEGLGQDLLNANPVLQQWVTANCTRVAQFGHYRIYAPRPER